MDLKTLGNKIEYDNNPNVINMILSLKNTNQTDEVIIFTLQQYGYTDDTILSALEYVNKNIKKLEKQNMVKENNTFSLVSIFNKAQNLKAQLRNYILDETLSFVAQNAINDIDRNFDFMKCQIIEQISNGTIDEAKSELGIAYKYAVVESLYSSLSKYSVEEIKSFTDALLSLYEAHKYEFEAARIINESNNGKTLFFKGQDKLVNEMNNFLTESSLSEEEFVEILENNSWSKKCQDLLTAIESSKAPKEHVYDSFKVYESISPVTTVGNKMIVNLFGSNYSYNGKCFEEYNEEITDTKYNNVLEGLSVMSYNPEDKTLTYNSKYGKNLEYDLSESIIRVGQLEFKLDSILECINAISSLNVFNSKEDYSKVMKLLESREIINELDNCKTIVPNNSSCVAHIFESNNGTSVLYVDKKTVTYESFNLKSKLVESVAEKLNCKIDSLFETEIRKEDKTKYARECEIEEIQTTLKFLGEKRSEFVNLNVNNDERLNETIKLIDEEIISFEKKLKNLI